MGRLNRSLKLAITSEQYEEWTKLAEQRNLSKSELVRRILSNCDLVKQKTKKDLELYQKLGKLKKEIEEKREECFHNPTKTIDQIIKAIDELRLEIID